MASKRRNMFHKNKTQETTEKVYNMNGYTVAVLLASFLLAGCRAEIGPFYSMQMRSLTDCENPGTNEMRMVGSKIRKQGKESYIFNSDFILPYGFSNDLGIGVNASIMKRTTWQHLYSGHFSKLCQTMSSWVPAMVTFVTKKLAGRNDCPVKPGNYTIKDAFIKEIKVDALSLAPYGKYMVEFSFTKNSKTIGCKIVNFDLGSV
ncbi:hypothetical protein AAG570_004469 [Ranatra chinensis]|uniref:MD-2-related lipid-recognition domain-containing protein n=1 Tax=Ranatra chinensis TaxID=642074 RepID=A0ABD0Y110_9HEMI